MRRRISKRDEQDGRVVGLAWYSPEQWAILKRTAADTDVLHDTYAEWLTSIQETLDRFRAHGVEPIQVPIDMEELAAWCAVRHLPLTGENRSRFTAEKMSSLVPRNDALRKRT